MRATGFRTMISRARLAFSLAARASPGPFVLYVAMALVGGAVPVLNAWLLKMVVDGLAGHAPMTGLTAIAAGMAVTGLVITLTPQTTQYLRAEMDRSVGCLVQNRLFSAVERFTGLARFENPHFLDHLRLAQQTGGIAPSQVVDGILSLTRVSITIIGFLVSLSVISPMLAALVLAAGVPTLVAELVLSRKRAGMLWEIGPAERREIFYSELLTSLEAAKEIRLFGIGGFLKNRMLGERRTANAAKRAVDRRELLVQTGLGVLAAAVAGLGLLWIIGEAGNGRIAAGDVMIFITGVAGVQSALGVLAGDVARSHEALLLLRHFVAVTTAEPDLPVAPRPDRVPRLSRGIELRDVWFRYSPDHPWVLRGVDLFIPAGASVALVGLNGAGKSTLVKLLCRLYDPTSGSIHWDGVDLRDMEVADLRRRISVVFQDYMNYDFTAAENIALGDLEALDDGERIRRAAERAGIHAKLAGLPRGYQTLLSRMFFMESEKGDLENGVELSGGQWQRLALARAFVRDGCDFMILDEPSSGLDAEAEHDIHASIRRHRADRTSVLISHRLSTVRDADAIVVLSEGRVVERGDHQALMRLDGRYAELFGLQASGYRDAAESEMQFADDDPEHTASR
ncbi:ABC transporter ATP-binding protein [Actinomadura formosensis]|uniref:ABC transporter ATP-binding protein n=1 Tax=Actinomadura formosensis TaxID=60706 RepID=UPI000832D320|nr:ABC transporter ATP-binding protein [Actinomadura formosensis]